MAKRHMRKWQKPEKLVKVSDEIHKLRSYPHMERKDSALFENDVSLFWQFYM